MLQQAGRAASSPPAVVVLDEVDAALDQTNQALVAALLKVSVYIY
jgi:chromosome segregation ATPase